MKARYEFPNDEAYYEYLRHYYAGLAMQGFITRAQSSLFTSKEVCQLAEMWSDQLINQLKQKQ